MYVEDSAVEGLFLDCPRQVGRLEVGFHLPQAILEQSNLRLHPRDDVDALLLAHSSLGRSLRSKVLLLLDDALAWPLRAAMYKGV